MHARTAALVVRYTGRSVTATRPLGGGCVGEVILASLAGGGRVVAKFGPGIAVEGWMLRYLAAHSHLPVPHVVHAGDEVLLMEWVEAGDPLDAAAQGHAAEVLAGLHAVSWHSYGLERDTVIGGLPQPNPPARRWVEFFRDHRLLHMAGLALQAGRLPPSTMTRIETLASRLGQWLDEPPQPALIHGDAWGGNLLCRRGRVAAFIDPAIYYADPEMDLAFGTLFATFGEPFFARYGDLRPGFWEVRRDLYNLYPLLVHVRLFGGSYLQGVETTLDRLVG